MRSPWPWIGLAALGVGALMLTGDGPSGGTDVKVPKPVTKRPGAPMAIGEFTDPSVAPLLALLKARFIARGIDLELVPVWPLVVMSKAPAKDGPDDDDVATRPGAIPPLELWDGFVEGAWILYQILLSMPPSMRKRVRQTGFRSGFGPNDYNSAVGGADNSRHVWADAFDLWVPSELIARASKGDAAAVAEIKEFREALKMAIARYIVKHRKDAGWGFGAYTNDAHFDLGRKTAGTITTWEQGRKYIDRAKAELGIA